MARTMWKFSLTDLYIASVSVTLIGFLQGSSNHFTLYHSSLILLFNCFYWPVRGHKERVKKSFPIAFTSELLVFIALLFSVYQEKLKVGGSILVQKHDFLRIFASPALTTFCFVLVLVSNTLYWSALHHKKGLKYLYPLSVFPLFLISFSFLFQVYQKKQLQEKRDSFHKYFALVSVAKTDCLEGEKITTEHISFRIVPREYMPQTAYFYKDREQIIGLTCKYHFTKGEYFLDASLSFTENAIVCGPKRVPYGYRAISLKFNFESGVSGHCQPYSRVDIVATIPKPMPPVQIPFPYPEQEFETFTVLPYSYIVATDKYTGKIGETIPKSYSTITFLLTPLECQVLLHLKKVRKAKFTLLLRNPNEAYQIETSDPRKFSGELFSKKISECFEEKNDF